ncbi:MAG: autotransporter outer membrane beta-barrel domain-containing protein [Verrucomicrobiales bacterium]|jgi:outer membrane autotransporter protein|nr:autotransporter outer membrane beta-barrel domain-containing protein [Verrucomicrobiales bacterium]
MSKYWFGKIAVLAAVSALSLSARADDYEWWPTGTFYIGDRVNWEDTEGMWYNYNGISYYRSGIPGDEGNRYHDNAYISNSWVYPTVSSTVPVLISNLFVDGGSYQLTANSGTGTEFVIRDGSFTTEGALSRIYGTDHSSLINNNTWEAYGGDAYVTVSGNGEWHNLGALELSGKSLRTGGTNTYNYINTYGILQVADTATMRNDGDLRLRTGSYVFVSGSGRVTVGGALDMSGDDGSTWSSFADGHIYLYDNSTLVTNSATISYDGGGYYAVYVEDSSSWTNNGDLSIGHLDNSGGGVYIESPSTDFVSARFINSGLLYASEGSNSYTQFGLHIGSARFLGTGTNHLATGENSHAWLGAANHSTLIFAGDIVGASGTNAWASLDVLDYSTLTAGNLTLASGADATGWLGVDRYSTVRVGNFALAGGVAASGTTVVSRNSTLTVNNMTVAEGVGSDVTVILERDARLVVNGDLNFAPVGSGSLRIDNSELTVSGNLNVAQNAGSSGVLNLVDDGRARLNVGGTLAFGDGDYPDLQLNGDVRLGALASTKELNVTFNGNTVISGSNDYVGSTTIAFRAQVTLSDTNAQFGRAGSAGVTNLGAIRFGNGNTQSTLTVYGDYLGGDGSSLHMTARMDGGAPIVDRVFINGDSSGATTLFIDKSGKSGGALAATDIITISGVSGATFTLNGGSLYSGMYKYDLATDGQNWTLSGVKTMSAANAILNIAASAPLAWFAQLDSLRGRLAETRFRAEQSIEDYIAYGRQEGDHGVDFWARSYGRQADTKLNISGVEKFTDMIYGIDLGADMTWRLDAANSLTFGYFVGYGGARHDFKNNGDGDTNSFYGGFYGTWLNQAGWFADLVLKGQYAENSFDARAANDVNFRDRADFKNWAGGAALSAGKRFDFAGGAFVEPSVQAAYLRLFNGNYSSDVATVRVNAADIGQLAANVRGGWTFKLGDQGQTLQPYLRGGALEQISAGNKVHIGGDADDVWRVHTDGLYFLGGAGVQWQITTFDQLRLEYDAIFGDHTTVPWNLNLGYRHQF